MNYAITRLIDDHICTYGPPNYAMLNAMIGVLECAKLELYSRYMIDYEAKKERENGDVYSVEASRENRAWAGGFFEGEGCFYAHYYKPRQDGSKVYRTAASLTQKNEALLKQFQNVVKCGIVYSSDEEGMHVWKTTKVGEAKKTFDLLRPYLGERRQSTFLNLDAEENSQVFRPAKPPRTHCSLGHDLDEVGKRKDGTCAECDREYKRRWYHENK